MNSDAVWTSNDAFLYLSGENNISGQKLLVNYCSVCVYLIIIDELKMAKVFDSKSGKGYVPFIIAGLLLTALLSIFYVVAYKKLGGFWTELAGIVLSMIAAFLAEKLAQKQAQIVLVWARFNARRMLVALFMVLMFGVGFYISLPSLLNSKDLYEYLTNMAVIYLFSGALLEAANFFKREA